MMNIAKTGFLTSLTSYAVFTLADFVRPGFVSYVFSVHWFLLSAILFGVWWGFVFKEAENDQPNIFGLIGSLFAKTTLSTVIFLIFWRVGQGFGDMRGFLALTSASLPWLMFSMLKSQKELIDLKK